MYIGGSPYESNIIFVKNYDEAEGSYKFLHKDYLGSILAITDEEGNKLEQRHYDAWGNLTHLQIKGGGILTGIQLQTAVSQLLIDRGYTGHEHFFEVGIIHMNGRLYDPMLRRFLNADENIQDPHNTQNYNKYGYVFNNPLMFNDPSGEFIFAALAAWLGSKVLAAAVIGAAVGLVGYTVGLAVSGNLYQWNLGGALKATFFGAVGGAVSFGLGELFQVSKVVAFLGKAKFLVQAGAHGISQGVSGVMQGGDFLSSAIGGFAGSLGASAFGAIAGEFANSTVGTVAFGALSGGIGAELSGGNFWQGAVTGGIVAGLNHAMHKMDPPSGYKGKEWRDNTGHYESDGNGGYQVSNSPSNIGYYKELDNVDIVKSKYSTSEKINLSVEAISSMVDFQEGLINGESGKTVGKYVKILDKLGKGGLVIQGFSGGIQSYKAYMRAGGNVDYRTQLIFAENMGGIIGGYYGAKIGAAAGFVLGGPVGAAFGTVIGGMFYGYIGKNIFGGGVRIYHNSKK